MFFIISLTDSVNAFTFSDISSEDWFYETSIAGLEHGYIGGFNDGTFRPRDKVTYGQLYKMLVNAADIQVSKRNMEYSSEHWARPYAEALLNNGSKEIRRSNLDDEVSRKVAIKVLLETFGVKFTFNSRVYKNQPFIDMPLPDIYNYDGYIYAAHYFGIAKGFSNKTIKPDEALTRAEIVTLIERALTVDDWMLPEPERIENINIGLIGNINKNYYDKVFITLDKFPLSLLKDFSEDGGEIIITDEKPKDIFGEVTNDVAGNYSPNDNKIIIYANSPVFSSESRFEDTLEHEIGHYLFFNILSNYDKEVIREIFNEGIEPENLSKILNDKYCTTSVEEFFAEIIDYILSFENIKNNNEKILIEKSLKIIEKYIPIEF